LLLGAHAARVPDSRTVEARGPRALPG